MYFDRATWRVASPLSVFPQCLRVPLLSADPGGGYRCLMGSQNGLRCLVSVSCVGVTAAAWLSLVPVRQVFIDGRVRALVPLYDEGLDPKPGSKLPMAQLRRVSKAAEQRTLSFVVALPGCDSCSTSGAELDLSAIRAAGPVILVVRGSIDTVRKHFAVTPTHADVCADETGAVLDYLNTDGFLPRLAAINESDTLIGLQYKGETPQAFIDRVRSRLTGRIGP